jgi:hypothetical protein
MSALVCITRFSRPPANRTDEKIAEAIERHHPRRFLSRNYWVRSSTEIAAACFVRGVVREIRQQGPYHDVFSRYVDPFTSVQPGETVAIYTDDVFESWITRADGGHRLDPSVALAGREPSVPGRLINIVV